MDQFVQVMHSAQAATRLPSAQHLLLVVHFALIGFLCVLILYPTFILLNLSVRDESGAFSFVWYLQAYTSLRNYRAIGNTLVIACASALITILVGTFFAWAVVRTDLPGRRLVE